MHSSATSALSPLLQEQLDKQRAAEVRLEAERRRLREALEASEARATRVEVGRRSLEGELQRLRLSLGDREAESQASHDRHEALLKQVQSNHISIMSLVGSLSNIIILCFYFFSSYFMFLVS